MCGTDTQIHPSIDNIFTQSERQVHRSLLRLLIADGIVVDTACHSGNVGIEAVTILCADHLLEDYSHLLLVNHVRRGHHVVFAGTVEHRSIDSLDGIAEHAQPLVDVVTERNHVGGIDTSKRLVMCIFEQ